MDSAYELKQLFNRISRRVRLFMWESGQGQVLCALPDQFGKQLVLSLPEQNLRFPLHYYEKEGRIFTFLSSGESAALDRAITENSAVEVWMRNGWYAASAHFLTDEEAENELSDLSVEGLFGKLGCRLTQGRLECLRIAALKRVTPRAGEKGPGNLSWVWFAAGMLFCGMWLKDRKK